MKSRVAFAWPFHVTGAIVACLTLSGAAAQGTTDRDRDGFVGLVHRVVSTTEGTSTTRTYSRDGALLETVTRSALIPIVRIWASGRRRRSMSTMPMAGARVK